MTTAPSKPDSTIRVLVMDDCPVVRDGLMQWLSRHPDLEVCGHFSAAEGARASLGRARVDVLLLDVMPSGAGEIATRLGPSSKTIHAHRENIKNKLGLDNASELMRHAAAWVSQHGVVRRTRSVSSRRPIRMSRYFVTLTRSTSTSPWLPYGRSPNLGATLPPFICSR